ncbi:unnamed protein product [Caenorhabditis angaria]|uniref:Uncharacterized protein n=1 Tax=Caenorhabditis angaria TaxID=860376 RepID=A0A9P1MRZ4_9PELO|nr:unnamed protein product [Caenorhabditis angaria]
MSSLAKYSLADGKSLQNLQETTETKGYLEQVRNKRLRAIRHLRETLAKKSKNSPYGELIDVDTTGEVLEDQEQSVSPAAEITQIDSDGIVQKPEESMIIAEAVSIGTSDGIVQKPEESMVIAEAVSIGTSDGIVQKPGEAMVIAEVESIGNSVDADERRQHRNKIRSSTIANSNEIEISSSSSSDDSDDSDKDITYDVPKSSNAGTRSKSNKKTKHFGKGKRRQTNKEKPAETAEDKEDEKMNMTKDGKWLPLGVTKALLWDVNANAPLSKDIQEINSVKLNRVRREIDSDYFLDTASTLKPGSEQDMLLWWAGYFKLHNSAKQLPLVNPTTDSFNNLQSRSAMFDSSRLIGSWIEYTPAGFPINFTAIMEEYAVQYKASTSFNKMVRVYLNGIRKTIRKDRFAPVYTWISSSDNCTYFCFSKKFGLRLLESIKIGLALSEHERAEFMSAAADIVDTSMFRCFENLRTKRKLTDDELNKMVAEAHEAIKNYQVE